MKITQAISSSLVLILFLNNNNNQKVSALKLHHLQR
jgi:hypothetical protein